MRYDIENFINDIEDYMQLNLNSKLASIDAEKGDDFIIEKISDNAYIKQDIAEGEETALSQDPFIIHGVTDIRPIESGPGVAKQYEYDITIIFNKKSDGFNLNRVWRYQRGLGDLIEDGWNAVHTMVKLEVSNLAPIPIALRKAPSEEQWAVGIRLSFVLT